jgi:hypothetical protein
MESLHGHPESIRNPPMPQRFRQSLRSYRKYLVWALVPITMFYAALMVWRHWGDPGELLRSIAMVFGVFTATGIALLGLLAILAFVYAVTVDERGVKAFTFIGTFRTISWGSITDVEVTTMTGITYFALRSTESRPRVYVPVDIVEFDRFAGLVLRYAGPDHPLTHWLQPEGAVVA